MKIITLLCFFTLFFSTTLMAKWSVEESFKVKEIKNVALSPDAQKTLYLVKEVKDWKWQTHLYVNDTQVSNRECSEAAWTKEGAIIFLSENSFYQIDSVGENEKLLGKSERKVETFRLSPNGKAIAFVMSPLKKKQDENTSYTYGESAPGSHLYLMNISDGTISALTSGDFHVGAGLLGLSFDWSPNSEEIAFPRMPEGAIDRWTEARLWIVNVQTKELTPLVTTSFAIDPHYSPDGKTIVYISAQTPVKWEPELHLSLIGNDGKNNHTLPETFNCTPAATYGSIIGWSSDGKCIYVEEVYKTENRIYCFDKNGSPPKTLKFPKGVLSSVMMNGDQFAFTLETDSKPVEVYKTNGKNVTQISHVNQELNLSEIAKTETIQWTSKDGLEIEGLLTYPKEYNKEKKYPLLLIIHGGPSSLFRNKFIGSPSTYPIATFASDGFAVLRCNIRGSTGYGCAFRSANLQDWGGKDFQDLMSGVDSVIALGIADPEKLGVMGWSYGGFMTAWVITQTNRFKAASVGAAITDALSFAGTTDVTSFLSYNFRGEVYENAKFYLEHSPLIYVGNIQTPVLIQFGEDDKRVPFSQGIEFYNALKRKGDVTVEMEVYPKTEHCFTNPKLHFDASRRNVEWFSRYLNSNLRS